MYVLHVDDDTIAVFPTLEFKDSTAILIDQRTNYTSLYTMQVTRHYFFLLIELYIMLAASLFNTSYIMIGTSHN